MSIHDEPEFKRPVGHVIYSINFGSVVSVWAERITLMILPDLTNKIHNRMRLWILTN